MKKILALCVLFICIFINLYSQEEINLKVVIYDLINLGDSNEESSAAVFKNAIKGNLRFALENNDFDIIEDIIILQTSVVTVDQEIEIIFAEPRVLWVLEMDVHLIFPVMAKLPELLLMILITVMTSVK